MPKELRGWRLYVEDQGLYVDPAMIKFQLRILLKLADPRLYLHKIFMYGWVWLSGELWAFQSLLYNPEEKKSLALVGYRIHSNEIDKSIN